MSKFVSLVHLFLIESFYEKRKSILISIQRVKWQLEEYWQTKFIKRTNLKPFECQHVQILNQFLNSVNEIKCFEKVLDVRLLKSKTNFRFRTLTDSNFVVTF